MSVFLTDINKLYLQYCLFHNNHSSSASKINLMYKHEELKWVMCRLQYPQTACCGHEAVWKTLESNSWTRRSSSRWSNTTTHDAGAQRITDCWSTHRWHTDLSRLFLLRSRQHWRMFSLFFPDFSFPTKNMTWTQALLSTPSVHAQLDPLVCRRGEM